MGEIGMAAAEEVVSSVMTHLKNGKIEDALAGFAEEFRFKDHGIGLEFKEKERLFAFRSEGRRHATQMNLRNWEHHASLLQHKGWTSFIRQTKVMTNQCSAIPSLHGASNSSPHENLFEVSPHDARRRHHCVQCRSHFLPLARLESAVRVDPHLNRRQHSRRFS
jgi:hypothetical protein